MSEREQRAAAPGANMMTVISHKAHGQEQGCHRPNPTRESLENSPSPASGSQAPGVSGAEEGGDANCTTLPLLNSNDAPGSSTPGAQTPIENNDIRHEAAGNLSFLLFVIRNGEILSPDEEANVRRVIVALNVATPVQECGECTLLKSKIKTLEIVIASQARLIESRKGIEAWAASQPDLPAGGTVLEGVKGLVERLRANVKRLEDLCHRWNKMAAHFAAGSEFVNDPERVLEALKSRQEMAERLREKRREQTESLEQSLAAVREESTTHIERMSDEIARLRSQFAGSQCELEYAQKRLDKCLEEQNALRVHNEQLKASGLRDNVQRLWDLVRFKRHDLLNDEIISQDEFAALVQDHPAVARLETNDSLRYQLTAAQEEIAAKVSALATALFPDSPRESALAEFAFEAMGACQVIARLKRNSYPHMCRMDHQQIGHSDSEYEMCPLCRAISERDAAQEELRVERERLDCAIVAMENEAARIESALLVAPTHRWWGGVNWTERLEILRAAVDAARSQKGGPDEAERT